MRKRGHSRVTLKFPAWAAGRIDNSMYRDEKNYRKSNSWDKLKTKKFLRYCNCFNVYLFERERKRERERAGEGQRERETPNPNQAPGSEPSAQTQMWGPNPQTASP